MQELTKIDPFIQSVAAKVIAAGIIALCATLFAWAKGWFKLPVRWLGLSRRLAKSGISNFYCSRDDYSKYRGAARLIDYLSLANHSAEIIAYWMSHGNEMEGVAEDIANLVRPPKRLDVTIGIVDPTSPFLAQMASYLGMNSSELVLRVQSSLANLHAAKQRLAPDEQSRLKLKVYHEIPIASVIILDGRHSDGRLQLDFKPYRVPRQYSFGLELQGKGKDLFDRCNNAWSKLLADATDFDSKIHLAHVQRENQ